MEDSNINPIQPIVTPAPQAADSQAPVTSEAENVAAPSVASANAPDLKITLDQLVNLCIEKGASDVHFREGSRVALRVGGKIIFIENIEALTKEDTEAMLDLMISSEEEGTRLEKDREIDFSFTHANGVNFRVNAFYQKGKLACVMRMISKNIPTLEELGIPEVMKSFLGLREGLILVCGTAGSGKSTTIQSMLQHVNKNFVQHVLTIENPIEYVFENEKSMFTQREVGKDTLLKENALQSAIREDANIVMLDEVNDFETFDKLLNLVETGHLVIASMLTRDVPQAIERIISLYPQDLRKQAQDRLSDNLTSVLAQDLVQRQDQPGLIAVFELLFMNDSIRNVIKRGNFVQLRTAIQSSAEQGMITMDSYAYQLSERGVINQEQLNQFIQKEEQ
ncbi:PilT/PilU family type 4a pilus ATPase [Candidatus Pacearchaeota archaeon]|nr:PilT/PilU family type 4a pilus ATPase [Candidatus Pacearchaeota archaeon]